MPRRYVLTGAPGAGKTALAMTLRQRGYLVVAEAATDLIAHEQARGVDEPWRTVDFLDNIARLQRQHQLSQIADPISVQIYDRSPLCTLALARYLQRPVTPLLTDEVTRVIDNQIYQRAVFFVRLLGFITPTHVRRISYPDSLRFEAIHEAVYRKHGFQLVDIPAATIDHRAAAVDSYIRSQPSSSQPRARPAAPTNARDQRHLPPEVTGVDVGLGYTPTKQHHAKRITRAPSRTTTSNQVPPKNPALLSGWLGRRLRLGWNTATSISEA